MVTVHEMGQTSPAPVDPVRTDAGLRECKRDIVTRATTQDPDGAQAAAMDLYSQAFERTAAGEATAVRPLD